MQKAAIGDYKRRTKIVATLGPASESATTIGQLIDAGANVFRLNFSHGSHEEHKNKATIIRRLAEEKGKTIAILGDLQGPKIRIAKFKSGSVHLQLDQVFILDASLDKSAGDEKQVGIDYPDLAEDCRVDDTLLLDDGRIQLVVTEIKAQKVFTKVTVAGTLSNNKGINRLGGGLSAPALTEKDFVDIAFAASLNMDYVAVSFPRCAEDILKAKKALEQAKGDAGIVAKIERAEIIQDDTVLNRLIEVSDVVMVARGDLGVEIGDAELVSEQKKIISRARSLDKMVITATQMMESMIESAMPTRAEVFDVANAVIDGTDAVMLSAESAAGHYPVEAVAAMSRIIEGAEKYPPVARSGHRMDSHFTRIDEAIALSAMYAANHLDGVKAIVCMTETGRTPRIMSRISSAVPIFAFARQSETRRRLALCRGVHAIDADIEVNTIKAMHIWVSDQLKRHQIAQAGDLVIFANGDIQHQQGGTNTMTILTIAE